MKTRFFLCISIIISIFILSGSLSAQSTIPGHSETTLKTAEGDTMWILLNHIKADKREQFEKFVHEILWPIGEKCDGLDKQVFNHTRVLHPAKMNKDSTYTYIFLMDPVIPKGNYRIIYFLKKKYDEAQAKKYNQMWRECFKIPQVEYVVIQSRH